MTEKDLAIKIAKKAGKRAAEAHADLEAANVRVKGDASVVTDVDISLNEYLRDEILKEYPDHEVISEELERENGGADNTWVIDPIDGTRLYTFGLPTYGVALAKLEKGTPVLSVVFLPEMDQLFVAEKGEQTTLNGRPVALEPADTLEDTILMISPAKARSHNEKLVAILPKIRTSRHFGCITIDTFVVLTGRASGSLYGKLTDWDAWPSIFLVQQAGGVALNKDGKSWQSGDDMCVLGTEAWCRMMVKELG